MVSKPLLLRTEPNRRTGELGALHETPAVGLTVQCCPGANSKPFLPKELGSGLLQALGVYAYGPDPTGLGHLFQPPPPPQRPGLRRELSYGHLERDEDTAPRSRPAPPSLAWSLLVKEGKKERVSDGVPGPRQGLGM